MGWVRHYFSLRFLTLHWQFTMPKAVPKPKKRKKRSPRQIAVKKADDAFSLYIRARDNFKCVTCGAVENIQCGHLFTRSYYAIRWDEENAFCQCAGCNMSHEYDSYPLTSHYLMVNGERRYHELHMKGKKIRKFTTEDLNEIAEVYTAKLREIS